MISWATMKPPSQTPQEPWNDDLNDWVMEAASLVSTQTDAPGIGPRNADVIAWDERLDAAGHRVERELEGDDENMAEALVEAGNEEADREQRLASALNQSTLEQR